MTKHYASLRLPLLTLAFLTIISGYEVYTRNVEEWQRVPALDTFASYEDMQRYFTNRNLRSLRVLDNPTHDSYVEAYNQHNEQPAAKRAKRGVTTNQDKLPSEPKFFKFEISDAVEPSAEVKEMIRRHRSRELQQLQASETKPTTATKQQKHSNQVTKNVGSANSKRAGKLSSSLRAASGGRSKRAAATRTLRQPDNFQVKLIPFQVSDAREPDAQTKALIKRMRALELEKIKTTALPQLANPETQATPTKPLNASPKLSLSSKGGKLRLKQKSKRVKRSASHTPPEMIKFELADAKDPDTSIKLLLHEKHESSRESKNLKQPTLLTGEQSTQNATNAKEITKRQDQEIGDMLSEGSKRHYIYKEVPNKAKKSIGGLPHEVQKVITHLLKDNNGAKAFVKYIPAHQIDYRHLKTLYNAKMAQPVYTTKLQPAVSYIKYVPVIPKAEQVQVQIHPVPVVEKVRYIYTPVVSSGGHAGGGHAGGEHAGVGHAGGEHAGGGHAAVVPAGYSGHSAQSHAQAYAAISHPIVVHESAGYAGHVEHVGQQHQHQQPTEIHHTYTADLTHAHAASEHGAQAIKDGQAPNFHPSKPDVTYDENKLIGDSARDDGSQSIEHYKYEVYSHPPAAKDYEAIYGKPQLQLLAHQHQQAEKTAEVAPVIKIEYHAAPDPIKENYKEMQEFKELSTLIGKSPEDQIHGLTYLLAKEMQTKLQLQKKIDGDAQAQRAHRNTAPILFHPEEAHQLLQSQEHMSAAEHASLAVQPGRLIGMAKSKEYIPIVESAASAEQKLAASVEQKAVDAAPAAVQHFSAKVESKIPPPSSFVEFGLSPNYEGFTSSQVVHHPTVSHHGLVGVGAHHGLQVVATAAPEHSGESHSAAAVGDVEAKHDAGVVAGAAHQQYVSKLSNSGGLHFGDSHDMQYASKYAFGYRIRDFYTGNDFGHKQNRDLDGVTRGQYHILLPDGRIQNVIYHADDTGFHADVSFESGAAH